LFKKSFLIVEVVSFDRKAAEEESTIMGRLLSPLKFFELDVLVY